MASKKNARMLVAAYRLLLVCSMFVGSAAGRSCFAADVAGPSAMEVTVERAIEQVGTHGDLDLSHLRVLAPQVAELLGSSGNTIMLNGLTSLSPESAAALSQPDAFLELNGLTELPLDTARALITPTTPRTLSLLGLTAIGDEVAEILGETKAATRAREKTAVTAFRAAASRPTAAPTMAIMSQRSQVRLKEGGGGSGWGGAGRGGAQRHPRAGGAAAPGRARYQVPAPDTRCRGPAQAPRKRSRCPAAA